MAGHLRFAYATVKINAEVERIGDYAESIARQVLKLSALDPQPSYDKFVEIASLSIPMLRDAVRSFVAQDADLARATMAIEEKVNTLRDEINAELLRAEKSGRIRMEAFTPLTMVARRYERVSDQAKNICEEVLYMCTGEFSKHAGAEGFHILFLDDDNASRSPMAEGIANSLHKPKLSFSSAGIHPKPVDPKAVSFMLEKGIDISRHAAKSFEQGPHLSQYQVVIAFSKEAHQSFQSVKTKTVLLDWPIIDPSTTHGSPEQVQAAYEAAFQQILAQINDLAEAILGNSND